MNFQENTALKNKNQQLLDDSKLMTAQNSQPDCLIGCDENTEELQQVSPFLYN